MDRWEKIGIYLSKKIAEMDGWMMVDHVSWESIEFFVGKNDGIHGDKKRVEYERTGGNR